MAGGFSDGAWRRKPATSRRNVRVLLLVLGLAIAGLLAGPLSSAMQSGLSPTTSPARVTESGLTSWNPHVSCSADLVTIRDVLGPAYPTQTVNGSRYQTNSTAGGIPQERALSPPCTITNKTGTVLSPFVQINSVSLYGYGVKTTDCSAWYSKQNGGSRYPNNQTFCSNAGQIITIGTTRGYMKIEIDRDWLGKGYCGVGVPYCDNATLGQYQSNGSISLDFQGFVFWEGPYHWELHPLTGWRLSAPPAPPSAPQNLAATGGNAQVTLTWQAPASDGGSPITNYKIYRGVAPSTETLLTTVGNVLTYTDGAVTNGLTYYYQVSAVNSPGEGAKSNEASATPSTPPPPPTPPSAPTNLVATAGNAQVGLAWQAPSSNGGSPITNYRIYRGTSSNGETLLATIGNVLTYTDTAVTNGVTYYYQVSAVNAAGEGPRSNEASAAPSPPPPPPPDFGISATPASLSIQIGSSSTSTIALTSLNGFAGTIGLSTSIACSGLCLVYPTASLNPTSVTLTAGGSGVSTLTVATSVLTTLGTYTITITATSGSITHTVTVTVTVHL
ncbi:MAG: fibronectin type III domain-containing protein [Methanobacteriota archaeon]|nr:MAG: fibronectin type III domain-containing protein [Euryarchaeota archaeon]